MPASTTPATPYEDTPTRTTGTGTGTTLPNPPSSSGTLSTGGGTALPPGDLSEFLEKYGEGGSAFFYGDEKATYKEDIPLRTNGQEAAGHGRGSYGRSVTSGRRLVARAEIVVGDSQTLDNAVQAFKAAHLKGGLPKKLYVRRYTTDPSAAKQAAYIWASVENVGGIQFEKPLTATDIEVAFVCYDPLFYIEPARQTPAVGPFANVSDTVYAVAYMGLAPGLPYVSFTVTSSDSAVGTIVIGNSLTGEYVTVTPDGPGDYLIDGFSQEIRKNGALYEWWDGDWFSLAPGGANQFRIITTGTVALNNLVFTWNDTEF